MRRLAVLSISALALVGATASAAVAERPVPNSVCGGACDGGGGVVPGGWCATPGQYGTWNGVVLRCDSGHIWRYA